MSRNARRANASELRELSRQATWPWEYEMIYPFIDVSAAFWRFLRTYPNSQIVEGSIVHRVEVSQLSLHIRRDTLTLGSERYSFSTERWQDKARRDAGEVVMGSAEGGRKTRIQLYTIDLPRDPRFDQVPVSLREEPRYLRALEQAEYHNRQHQELQRLLLSDVMSRFARWIVYDLKAFKLDLDDINSAPTDNVSIPSRPRNDEEWDDVFDWYEAHGEPFRMTLEELGSLIGFAESTVRNKRSALGRAKRVRKSTN